MVKRVYSYETPVAVGWMPGQAWSAHARAPITPPQTRGEPPPGLHCWNGYFQCTVPQLRNPLAAKCFVYCVLLSEQVPVDDALEIAERVIDVAVGSIR